jgi:hypothetical protein
LDHESTINTPYLKRLSCKLWRYDGIRNDFRTYKRGYGSMLELTWEEKLIKLNDGTERKFINDNDTVIMKGSVKMDRYALVSRSFF